MSVVPPSGWSPRKLNELGFVGRGKSKHRPRNAPSLYGGPYPFVQTGDVKAADLYILNYEQTYSKLGLAQSKLWDPGTLCITIAANIAETAILKIQACFPDSIVGFVADPDKADVRFVKYYIDTLKLQMQNASRGTTQDNLSLDKLLTFDFYVPPLTTQRKIAAILSAYDDLIEVNTRRIAILEEMARGLYREWFVRFRFPGHEGVRMVESAVGVVPQGWEVVKVKDTVLRLAVNRHYEQADVASIGAVPVVDQSRGEFLGFHNNVPDYRATPQDSIILFGDHTCKMRLMINAFSIGPNVVPFKARENVGVEYLFFAIRDLVKTQEYKRHWTELGSRTLLLAPYSLQQQFAGFVMPMFEQAWTLSKQNANLRRTRDLLLPRLVAGEVEVGDGLA
jgi:type I restriction enzyme, S subunit